MKAKKVVMLIVCYMIFVFVAFKGAMMYHDHREAQLITDFSKTVHYEPDEIYVTYYKGSLTWCPKDDEKKVETIDNNDYFYRDMLKDFKNNDNTLGVVFVVVSLVGAVVIGKIALSYNK